jgi:hypothetical protein
MVCKAPHVLLDRRIARRCQRPKVRNLVVTGWLRSAAVGCKKGRRSPVTALMRLAWRSSRWARRYGFQPARALTYAKDVVTSHSSSPRKRGSRGCHQLFCDFWISAFAGVTVEREMSRDSFVCVSARARRWRLGGAFARKARRKRRRSIFSRKRIL